MSEVITAEIGGNYELPPAGNQVATCIGLYVLGTLKETYEGHEKSVKKMMLVFELVNTNFEFKEGEGPEPFIMTKEFTHNIGSKANLRKFLNAWSGGKLKEDKVAASFNLMDLVGANALVNVVHDKTKKGKDYAAIISATPVPDGMTIAASRKPHLVFNINKEPFDNEGFQKLPEWIQNKIKTSEEYLKLSGAPTTTPEATTTQASANPFATGTTQVVDAKAATKLF